MIRRLIKWMLILFAGVVVLIVILLLSMDSIARVVAERQIRAATGMDVSIGRLSIGLATPGLTIEGLKLYNRPEYGGGLFIDLPELRVIPDVEAFSGGKLRFELIRFNLAEISIVSSGKGRSNLEDLTRRLDLQAGPARTNRAAKSSDFAGIDTLNVTLGRARIIDLERPQSNRDIRMGIDHLGFTSIKTEKDLETVAYAIALRAGAAFLFQALFHRAESSPSTPTMPRQTNAPSRVLSAESPATTHK